jgi:peptidoglycan/xylan/chitin deacetylase (PgdA/CDA1 family)
MIRSSTVLRAQRWLATRVLRNDLVLEREAGVVSFSFDDAPKSACDTGRYVLERLGCRGTWYIAGGLTDRLEQGRPCHSARDIQDLARSGHHIGCHTFSHHPCNQMNAAEMKAELHRNAAFFRQIGVPTTDMHFSFPLGAFDLGSKRVAAQTFCSSRITGGGIQIGRTDLNGLRSERLYHHAMNLTRLTSLVKEVALKRGWLIFYTHDVEDNPSQWGCTPKMLDLAVQSALDAGCHVLPVDQAITYWKTRA